MNAEVEFIFGYKRIDQQYGLVAPNIPNGLVMSLDLYNGIEEIKNIIFDEVKKILPKYKQGGKVVNQTSTEPEEQEYYDNDILRVMFENRSVNKQESQFDGFKWLSVELEDEIKQELQEYLNHQLSEAVTDVTDVNTTKDNINGNEIGSGIRKTELPVSDSLSLSVVHSEQNHEEIFAEKQPVGQEQIIVDIEPLNFNFDNIEQGFASGQDLSMLISSHQDNTHTESNNVSDISTIKKVDKLYMDEQKQTKIDNIEIQLKKEKLEVTTHEKSDIDSNMTINSDKTHTSSDHKHNKKVINYLTGNYNQYNHSIKPNITNSDGDREEVKSNSAENEDLIHEELTTSNFEFQFLHNTKGIDPRKFADDLVEHFLSHNHH